MILARLCYLVGLRHVLIEDFLGNRNQAGMGDPCSIVPGFYLAQFVGSHLFERLFIGGGIVANRNLGRHAAHGVNTAPVASLNQEFNVGTQERTFHGDERAVRQHEFGVCLEFLDVAEDVVPAAAIQAGGMLSQLIEDLIHFKGGENRFNQDGSANRSARNAQFVLREAEHVVPEARLEMTFQFRQIEIRARSFGD